MELRPTLHKLYTRTTSWGQVSERVATATSVAVSIVGAAEGQKGFAAHPRRWIIERTFGWISRCRRLARDYEATPSSALASLTLAAAMILVRRLARTF